jgi:hypothetical protein
MFKRSFQPRVALSKPAGIPLRIFQGQAAQPSNHVKFFTTRQESKAHGGLARIVHKEVGETLKGVQPISKYTADEIVWVSSSRAIA